MQNTGTSTIVQYVREGDTVTPFAVQRGWHRGVFVELARWRVPFSQVCLREIPYGIPCGPLTYGRADLIIGGLIIPPGFESLPFLSLQ